MCIAYCILKLLTSNFYPADYTVSTYKNNHYPPPDTHNLTQRLPSPTKSPTCTPPRTHSADSITFINITQHYLILQTSLHTNPMKKHMKLMRIYDIEKNYQLHKQRLNSIKSTDNTHKIIEDVWTNIQKVNHFKQHKINSELFSEKQKISRINTENNCLRDKMEEVSHRPNLMLTQQKYRKEPKSEVKLSRKKSFFENINHQNEKIKQRLSQTKSSYFGITRNLNKSRRRRVSHQDEVIYLLEKQLKISPNVLFPAIKQQPKAEKHHRSIETNKKPIEVKQKLMEVREKQKQSRMSRMSRSGSKQQFRNFSSNGKVERSKLSSHRNSFV